MFSLVLGSIVSNARLLFKYALFATFIGALTTFSVWFVSFSADVYSIIADSFSAFTSNSLPSSLGCVLSALGIDQFLNSAFAIFFSAMLFWVTAVGYILTYKLGLKAYDGLFKALS